MEDFLKILMGALAGYGFGWLKDMQSDRRKRRAIATALAAELDSLSHFLSTLERTGIPDEIVESFATPVHDRFVGDVVYFEPQLVQSAFAFSEEMRRLRRCLEATQKKHENGVPWTIDTHMKVHGAKALAVLDAEMPLLIAAGATRVPTQLRAGIKPNALLHAALDGVVAQFEAEKGKRVQVPNQDVHL